MKTSDKVRNTIYIFNSNVQAVRDISVQEINLLADEIAAIEAELAECRKALLAIRNATSKGEMRRIAIQAGGCDGY